MKIVTKEDYIEALQSYQTYLSEIRVSNRGTLKLIHSHKSPRAINALPLLIQIVPYHSIKLPQPGGWKWT